MSQSDTESSPGERIWVFAVRLLKVSIFCDQIPCF